MGVYATLREHLAEWAGDDTQRRAIAETVTNLAKACVEVARIVALGPLAGDMASKRGRPRRWRHAKRTRFPLQQDCDQCAQVFTRGVDGLGGR